MIKQRALTAAAVLPAVFLAGCGLDGLSEEQPEPRTRLEVDGLAASSPRDPDAQFFWEMVEPPRSLVPLEEIISGGPPPDGIPAIDQPVFVGARDADAWLEDPEPVLAFQLDGEARAYPVQILMWHEIVNDIVADEPVTVTYCPLCDSAIVFSRQVGDRVVDFGTSGRLYLSDLVMYDRQTKSLWPQIKAQAVVGPLIGSELERLPSSMVSWREWRDGNPVAWFSAAKPASIATTARILTAATTRWTRNPSSSAATPTSGCRPWSGCSPSTWTAARSLTR